MYVVYLCMHARALARVLLYLPARMCARAYIYMRACVCVFTCGVCACV